MSLLRGHPDRMRFRRGMAAALQILFLALAAALTWGAVALAAQRPAETRWSVLVGLLAVLALLLAVARKGVVIDRGGGRVTAWWGVCVPFLWDLPLSRTRLPLADYRTVVLGREVWYQGDRGGGVTVFVVSLATWHEAVADEPAPATRRRLLLVAKKRYLGARRRAEAVGRFVDLGVVDDTSPYASVYRPAGSLDEPFAWRSVWTEELLEPPERPQGARSSYRSDADTGVVHVARRGRGWLSAVAFATALVAVAAAVMVGVPWQFPVGLSALPLLLWLVMGILPRHVWDRVRVSPAGVEVLRVSLLGWRRLTIASEHLEEIDIRPSLVFSLATIAAGGKVISVRSDRRIVELAPGLDETEQEWLLAVLRWHLLGLGDGA